MIFVDASAMISMMTGESDADALADRLETDPLRLCSAISTWETVAGLCHAYTFSGSSARAEVKRGLRDFVWVIEQLSSRAEA